MRPEKEQLVKDICGLIEPSPCLFLVTYKGLTAQAFEELRTTLEASAAQCHVVPNRLFKRAAAVCGMESVLETDLRGDTALVCGPETNPVTLAKTLTTFGKTHPQLTFKLGVIDGKPFGQTRRKNWPSCRHVKFCWHSFSASCRLRHDSW